MAPQRGRPQPAQPHAHLLGFGDTVRVLLPRHVDPHGGQEGTIRRTVLRGGDIVVTVEFAGGHREDYLETDLLRTAVHKPKAHPRVGNW